MWIGAKVGLFCINPNMTISQGMRSLIGLRWNNPPLPLPFGQQTKREGTGEGH